MAAIISNGTTDATGAHVAAGPTEMLASGTFNGATVQVTATADGQDPAPAYTFLAPGAVSFASAAGTILTATVIGGDSPSIDVTAN